MFVGCNTEALDSKDSIPPNEVKNLTAINLDGGIRLTWIDPTDDDFEKVRISYSTSAYVGTGRSSSNVIDTLIVEKGIQTCDITNLINWQQYTFTARTVDTNGNTSSGISVSTVPYDITINITLTPNTTEETNQDVTINIVAEAQRKTSIPIEISSVKYATGEQDLSYFADSGTEILLDDNSEYNFTVSENGTYTVYVLDTKGRENTKKITISNIDKNIYITLIPSTTVTTNHDIDINVIANLKSESQIDILSIKYASGEQELFYFTDNGIEIVPDANGEYNFTVSENGIYTVYILDSENQEEIKTIKINNIDKSMKIIFTPSEVEFTNIDISVNISVFYNISETPIESLIMKYASGEQELLYFADNGIEIIPNVNGEYNFTVSENGTYTVYVLNSDGQEEIKTVEINNIDKTSPNVVSDFSSVYSYKNKKILISWNTIDTDIDYYILNCSVLLDENTSVFIKNKEISETYYEINNIETESGTYTITIDAVDKAGNEGVSDSIIVATTKIPYITKIELDRYHIAYNDTNKEITVTVIGENFDLISSQNDTSVKIQFVDGSNVSNYEASVDTLNNIATATITAPSLSSATTLGTNYTIRVKLCGTIDIENTAILNISTQANVTSISLSESQISVNNVTSTTTTTVTVVGSNLDIAGAITLQLYDSTGMAYESAVTVDTVAFSYKETKFSADIQIPTVNDIYTVKILFNETAQSKTSTLQVYDVPKFTSFKIPYAGISKEDSTVIAIIIGKNFTAPTITENSFTVSCSSKASITNSSKVTIVSDTKLTVTLTIPGVADEYLVKVLNETNFIESLFTVKDYSKCEVGQIILANGTFIASDSYTAIDTSNPPIAVVFSFNDYGAAIGVGLHISSSSKRWTVENSSGYYLRLSDLYCTPSGTGTGVASSATFSNDIDGSDNWDIICQNDSVGTSYAARYYPAFYWVNTYGTTYSSFLGGIETDWYMPTLAELCYLYRNLSTVNNSLSIINNLDSNYADSTLGTNSFWSSSQYYSDKDSMSECQIAYKFIWAVGFKVGSIFHYNKVNYCYVVAIRAF